MKLDLLTNATVVDDAIRFVSDRSNDRQVIAMNMMAKEESNEPDYNKDKDQLEEEQEDETGTDEVVLLTTNAVF
jgi:hypothetical protein